MIINESVNLANIKYYNKNEIGIYPNPYNEKELIYIVKCAPVLQDKLLSIIRNLEGIDYATYNIYQGDNLLILSKSAFGIRPAVPTKTSMINHLPKIAELLDIDREVQVPSLS